MKKSRLGQWLQEARQERGWSHAEFARRCSLKRLTAYKLEMANGIPSAKTLAAVSKGLNVSPAILYRMVGLLPEASQDENISDQWKFLLSQLEPEDEEELRLIAEIKVNKHKKQTSLKALTSRKT